MRRGDPERIYQAQRSGILRRLVDAERVNELAAEHWISRWEREAEASGRARDDHYWDDAWDWIAENRRKQFKGQVYRTWRSRSIHCQASSQ